MILNSLEILEFLKFEALYQAGTHTTSYYYEYYAYYS